MAWTSADLANLEAAIAAGRGARKIKFADQEVEFQTIAEMLELRAVMTRAINSTSGRRLAQTGKGFG